MRELNQLNKVIMQKFSSRQAYTFIKGQYVPIILNNVSDETDNDELKDFISGIPGISLSNDNDEEDDDDSLFDELGLDRPTK